MPCWYCVRGCHGAAAMDSCHNFFIQSMHNGSYVSFGGGRHHYVCSAVLLLLLLLLLLQALMLMYQLLAGRNAVSERYYRALYTVLLTEGARGAAGAAGVYVGQGGVCVCV